MFKKKKILALIPARGGSKGIKLKNLIKINNIPLIDYTLKFINKLNFVDMKIVSSDNSKILNEGKKYGFLTIKRPKKLSGDRILDYDVINHVLNHNLIKKNNYDILLYLQPTSPIRKSSHIISALVEMIDKKYNAVWSISKIDIKNHPFKVFTISKNNLSLFSKKGKKIIARQQLSDIYIRNGVFYIFLIKELIKNKSIYVKKILPSVTNYPIVNIDNLKDLKKAKKYLR